MIFYRLLTAILLPFVFLFFLYRCVIKKEIFCRIKEKFGFATINRPDGKLVWLHGVSVGESRSALILVENYYNKFPDLNILITSSTLTSARIIDNEIDKNFSGRVFHQFLPNDNPFSVALFLRRWQPQVAIFLESEIWPNFLNVLKKSSTPSFLVNARISSKTAKRWRFAKNFDIKPFDNFNKIFVQNLNDITVFNSLSDSESFYYGNLKNEARPLDYDERQLKTLQKQLKNRKLFLAASTHQGEESKIIKIHQNLKSEFQDLLTIIVIRHPNRSAEVKDLLYDINYKTFDKDLVLSDENEVLLVDKMGILGLFYKLCDFAFIGGSLEEVGGHNPYEAINLDCAVITGRHYFNFQQTYDDLHTANGCFVVNDEYNLQRVVAGIFSHGDILSREEVLKNGKKSLEVVNDVSKKVTQCTAEFLF